jgi:hypothetical protein
MLQTHGYAAQQPSSANGMMKDTKPSSKGRRSSPARRPYPQRRGRQLLRRSRCPALVGDKARGTVWRHSLTDLRTQESIET